MLHPVGPVALAYLAGSGVVTNAGLVGRGLFRAVRRALDGDFREAGVEALAALTAPALLSYASAAAMVSEVLGSARGLINDLGDAAGPALPGGLDQ